MKHEKESMPYSLSDLLNTLLPSETVEHLLVVRKEMLLALRSWLDANIQALEKEKQERSKSPLKKVEVK